MIQLQGISQKRYIIDKDTIVAYTPFENRRIAILLLEGEEKAKLVLKQDELIKYKDSIINHQGYYIQVQDSTIKVTTDLIKDFNIKTIDYQNQIKKERKRKRTAQGIAVGSIVANIVFITALLL
jgi:hypothetical protein